MMTEGKGSSSSSLTQIMYQSSSINTVIIDYDKYLIENILFEIFLYLRLNSIFKFKLVSKLWLSVLSNPIFITKWMSFNSITTCSPWALSYFLNYPVVKSENSINNVVSPDLQSLCYHDGFSFRFVVSKLSLQKDEFIHVIASNNGLVLLVASNYHERIGYYVCNPLTKKYVSLPPPPKSPHWSFLHGFICEPSSSSPMSSSTTYTVVRLPSRLPNRHFSTDATEINIDIFASNLGEWRTFQVSCPQQVSWHKNMFICNGVSYWIEKRNRVIACNVTNNEKTDGGHRLRFIELPDRKGNDEDYYECLGESKGFISYSRCEGGELSVWVLDEADYFSSTTTGSWVWHLVHNIKIKDMLLAENCEDLFIKRLASGKTVNFEPLAFNPVDQNVLILGYDLYNVFVYNIRTSLLEVLIIRHPSPYIQRPLVITPWPTIL